MIYILIVVALVLLETKIKNHMEKTRNPADKEAIMNGKIILNKKYNRGMFMNFMEDKRDKVKLISAVLLGVLILVFTLCLPKKRCKLFKLGLSACLGGAISNVYERMTKGYVVDYFSFNFKWIRNIVFNLADMFIFIGSFFILISSFFTGKSK